MDTSDLDLRLLRELELSQESGQITLLGQRMLLMHGFSLAELRRELIERLGAETARGLFTRLGYQQGLEDALRIRERFDPSVSEALELGPRLRDLEGFVHNTPLQVRFKEKAGEFYGDFTWQDSWESEAHLKHFGTGGTPACWMNVGYATAFATHFFGRPVLAREVECMAMGHSRCHAIMRPLNEWLDVEADLKFLQMEDFVDPPVKRKGSQSGQPSEVAFEETSARTGEMVGASAAFNSAVYLLKRVAQTDATVLFLGESGVGKERFARALHQIGLRASGPFVSVNCAAIPRDLVEAELFGVAKGAFTGANEARPGRFERANGGTLFLDEIGSLPIHAQGKLLRAIQEREVERVGGTDLRRVDVRIVAATNGNLREAVEAGHFRADLFFRLNVFPIQIPPLRDRREDIPLMLSVFTERYADRFHKRIRGITRTALNALRQYEWPGNVRELENMVERAVILADNDGVLDIQHLFSGGERIDWYPPTDFGDGNSSAVGGNAANVDLHGGNLATALSPLLHQGYSLAQIEEAAIRAALARHGGKLAPAARELGLGRGQMQYRVSKLRERASSD